MAGPSGHASSHSFCTPCPKRGRAKGATPETMSFRGGGLPAQFDTQLTGIITHGGTWAPSLRLTGRPTRLPAFPLPRPSAPPRPHSCPTSAPLPRFPLQEPPTGSEAHQTHPPTRTAPHEVKATPLPSGLPGVTHFLSSLGLVSR